MEEWISQYLKVGRLLPGDNGEIRIIKDGSGRSERSRRPMRSLPAGEMDLSIPGKAVKFKVNGILFLAIRRQVVGMINEWPRRKAALFGLVE